VQISAFFAAFFLIYAERIQFIDGHGRFFLSFRRGSYHWHGDRFTRVGKWRSSRPSLRSTDGDFMMRPLSLFIFSSLILSLSIPPAFSATAISAEVNAADSAAVSNSPDSNLERLLPGIWNADNCGICKFNVINMGGFLYADMADWGAYGHSYSAGYQPIDIVSNDMFIYRGDYFQFYVLGGNEFRVENISNGGDRNVAGATRLTYYPAPLPPRPIPYPVPRPIPYPVPRPRPPRPMPRPIPHPPRPRPMPPRPMPPRPMPPRPMPPRPMPPRPMPPRPMPPRPMPPHPMPPRPMPPRPAPGHGGGHHG
jgi:hypothetical protein